MRILVATDAWLPQINGVIRTYCRIEEEAGKLGGTLEFLTPGEFRNFACPFYPEVRLALAAKHNVARKIDALKPDHIHIATEGPIGWATRRYCLDRGRPFTTSYHTKFPEYSSAILGLPSSLAYRYVRNFHKPSAGVMVATPSLASELSQRGFIRLVPWTRGVDMELFRPRPDRLFGSDRPVFLYAGRVSREKNLEAFLDAELPGLKVVIGEGPHLATLKRRYPTAVFTGYKTGDDLARHYASADVFVFPSTTDTFGLVLLEAMACGVPVAAFPVTGPIDIVENGKSGMLDWDLAKAATAALNLDRSEAIARAQQFSWQRAAQMFLDNIRDANTRAARERNSSPGPSRRGFPDHAGPFPKLEIMTYD